MINDPSHPIVFCDKINLIMSEEAADGNGDSDSDGKVWQSIGQHLT